MLSKKLKLTLNNEYRVNIPYIFRNRYKKFQVCTLIYGASLVAQLVKNPPAMQETPVLGGGDPLEEG